MAWGTTQYGVGPPSGSATSFTPQPNGPPRLLRVGRRGTRGGSEVIMGKDGEELAWGQGLRGTLSHTEMQSIQNLYDAHAKPNGGRCVYRRYNLSSDAWETVNALMDEPEGEPVGLGSDGAGPRWGNVRVSFKKIGLPFA